MRTRDWVTELLGLAAIVLSVLALGGALRWTQALVGVVAGAALISTITSRRVLGRPSPLVVLILVAIALTLLQLIPLWSGLLESVNPTGTALRDDGAQLLGLEPWNAISLDAPAALRALAFFVIVLAISVLALRTAVSEHGRYRILGAVAVLCGVTAVIVWLHELVGAMRVYGVYEPEHANPHLRGPLLNLNHLGCLMAVGTILGIGLVMYGRQAAWLRVLWVGVIAACGSLTVATVSRGATLSLAIGALVVAVVLVGQRLTGSERGTRSRSDLLTKSLPIGILAICTVVVVIYSSAGNVSRELGRTSFSELQRSRTKFAAWKASTKLIEESPWLGVGRGAFEPSFTRVYPDAGFSTFSHTENAYLQAVVDWGIVGGIAIAAALVWFWLVALRRWRDGPLSAAALGALAVVAIQSNVDFGIELLGLAGPVAAIAATVGYVPLREGAQKTAVWARIPRIAHIVAITLGCGLLLSSVTTTIAEDHDNIGQDATLDEIKASLARHPLDYFGYAQAAQHHARTGDRAAIPLLNHALRLHPTHPGLHRMAATLLLRDRYMSQAALEYAEALRVGGSLASLLGEIIKVFPTDIAATAIPVEYPHIETVVQQLEELGKHDVAIAWLARVRAHRPANPVACELMYAIVVRKQSAPFLSIVEKACGRVVLDSQTRYGVVQILVERGAHAEIIRQLDDVELWTGNIETKVRAWFALCDAHAALKAWDDAKRCLRRLEATGTTPEELQPQIELRLNKVEHDRATATP